MAEKRSIFEEVEGGKPAAPKPAGGLIDSAKRGSRGAVRAWLIALFLLVVLMIAVGGLTRLTDSGLSITEWKPVTGAVPPLSAEAWEGEFEKYQAIPEFRLQNKGMTLAEFKRIYWWEWGHRQLGRVVGLVWAAGFLFFLATKSIPPGWTARLLGLGILGGLQGAIGWWMVRSGLTGDAVDVASYRLAVHLGLAFLILGLIAWFAFLLSRSEGELMQARRGRDARLQSMTSVMAGLLFVQILLGALVAGIDAGRSFTDWPLMAGGFFPPEPFLLTPFWVNFFEDPGLAQFTHRIWAYLILIFALILWRRGRGSPHLLTRRTIDWLLVAIFGQIVIGIGTVIYAAPWQIAILHQLGAVAVWSLALYARFLAAYPKSQSIRGDT